MDPPGAMRDRRNPQLVTPYSAPRAGSVQDEKISGRSLVDWGPVRREGAYPWITVQALTVLRCAGRLELVSSPQAKETNRQTHSTRFEI
jgi:hypothetical protein